MIRHKKEPYHPRVYATASSLSRVLLFLGQSSRQFFLSASIASLCSAISHPFTAQDFSSPLGSQRVGFRMIYLIKSKPKQSHRQNMFLQNNFFVRHLLHSLAARYRAITHMLHSLKAPLKQTLLPSSALCNCPRTHKYSNRLDTFFRV